MLIKINNTTEAWLPSPCHHQEAVSPSGLSPQWITIQGRFFFMFLRAKSLAVSHSQVSCFVTDSFKCTSFPLRSKITQLTNKWRPATYSSAVSCWWNLPFVNELFSEMKQKERKKERKRLIWKRVINIPPTTQSHIYSSIHFQEIADKQSSPRLVHPINLSKRRKKKQKRPEKDKISEQSGPEQRENGRAEENWERNRSEENRITD